MSLISYAIITIICVVSIIINFVLAKNLKERKDMLYTLNEDYKDWRERENKTQEKLRQEIEKLSCSI